MQNSTTNKDRFVTSSAAMCHFGITLLVRESIEHLRNSFILCSFFFLFLWCAYVTHGMVLSMYYKNGLYVLQINDTFVNVEQTSIYPE